MKREMQIKTMIRDQLTSVRMAIIKKQEITSCGEDVEKREPCALLVNINWHSCYGKQYGVFSKN